MFIFTSTLSISFVLMFLLTCILVFTSRSIKILQVLVEAMPGPQSIPVDRRRGVKILNTSLETGQATNFV